MRDAVPEPVFPEEDSYPAYRTPTPIATESPLITFSIDQYVLTAMVATGTQLVNQPKFSRRVTEL